MEHPLVRIDKLHPDGSPRASWYGYRLADAGGATRIYRPARTRTIHVLGLWTPPEPGVSAFHPDWGFATHRYEKDGVPRLYIDVVRSVHVRRHSVAYIDLYLDVLVGPDGVREKDEDLLERLEPSEAERVRRKRDEVRRLIDDGFVALRPDGPFWDVPARATLLPPKMRRRSPGWPRV